MSAYNNYLELQKEIVNLAENCGRKSTEIILLPVSKTIPSEIINKAYTSGMKIFGENKVQEADSKFSQFDGDYKLHLIGHLQSNKSKQAVKLFDLIHSIDKFSTAKKLNDEAAKIEKKQKILLQVNTSGEETKSGCTIEQAEEICSNIKFLDNIELSGLMTIGPFTDDISAISKAFEKLRLLRDAISTSLSINLPELSMGMSSDYEIAIKEGSTIIRVGTAIFGSRNYE